MKAPKKQKALPAAKPNHKLIDSGTPNRSLGVALHLDRRSLEPF
jgi:hypothetical protein